MNIRTALVWIVGSLLIIPGAVYKGVRSFLSHDFSPSYICRIVQTGPQREALQTSYLAELMQLSADRPVTFDQFDAVLAQKRLQLSPVVKEVKMKVIKPDTVYVDYTVRQPVASLYDFENVALDEEGIPFPIMPFFSPKKLPEIYLGIQALAWGRPLQHDQLEKALTYLKMMQDLSLHVKRLDMTQAKLPSLGRREIVVILEENGFSKYLRLTPRNFAQEIGNYLELRSTLPLESQVIDLRIPRLAFIDNKMKVHNSQSLGN